jgi:hypothetical protein
MFGGCVDLGASSCIFRKAILSSWAWFGTRLIVASICVVLADLGLDLLTLRTVLVVRDRDREEEGTGTK